MTVCFCRDILETQRKKKGEHLDMDIGANIKRIRKSKGITQKTLSKNTEIPYRTLQDYENNKIKEPAVSKLAIIANKLNVTLGELTGEAEILKNELILRDSIAYEKNLEFDIAQKQESLRTIENAIESEKDPETLKKHFHRSNDIKTSINLYEHIWRQVEFKIQNSCESLGVTKKEFMAQNSIDDEKSNYIELLKSANKQINSLVKNNCKNEDRVLEQIADGKLECFQKLFTEYDLLFFCQAIDVLIFLKILVENNGPYIPLAIENLKVSLKVFFSNERIDIDPKLIDDVLDNLSKGFTLPPIKKE